MKSGLVALALAFLAPAETENAVANGDTRTISLYHSHTHESIVATFRVDGAYDQATLEKLNWFLRDWRRDEPTHMDPRLFDAVWEAYRESGSREPIVIVSAYRSPETNAMLRRRSRAVAEFSQHMLGKAMDMHYTDVPMSRVREIAMHLQRGGVGYYPTANSPFVHMDVGSVRAWPRMSREQLVRLFPDEKTVHLPADGRPLARYEEARLEVEARNGVSVPTVAQVRQKGFLERLFGGGEDDVVADAGPRAAPRVGGDARVADFIRTTGSSNAATRLASVTGGAVRGLAPGPAAPSSPSYESDRPSSFFVAEAARQPAAAPAAPVSPAVAPAPAAPAVNSAAATTVVAAAAAQPRAPASLAVDMPSAARTVANVSDIATPVVPAPPRRPSELALNVAAIVGDGGGVAIPRPPSRPAEFLRVSAAVNASRSTGSAGLPDMILNGGAAPAPANISALAYAPAPVSVSTDASRPTPRQNAPRVTVYSPARASVSGVAAVNPAGMLDRANFRYLTAPVDAAHLAPAAIAPVVTGLRSASHADIIGLVFAPVAIGGGDFDAARSSRPAADDVGSLRLRGEHAGLPPGALQTRLN